MLQCHRHHKRSQLYCALLIDHPQNKSCLSESQRDSQSFLELKWKEKINVMFILNKKKFTYSNPALALGTRKYAHRYSLKMGCNTQIQNQTSSTTLG